MTNRSASILLAACATLSNARAQALVADQALEIELKTGGALLEGHGPSSRFSYEVTFDGTLDVWAASTDFDPFLRITDSTGKLLAENDNSGGGTTAYLQLLVSRGELPTIHIASKAPGSIGRLLLHVSESPETDATRAAEAGALEDLAEAQRLREAGALGEARDLLRASLDHLLRAEGAGRSAIVARTSLKFAERAFRYGAPEVEHAACVAYRQHTERTLPDEHPELQNARQDLASTIKGLGDLAGARALEEKVLAVRSRTLPADHRALLAAQHNLANTLARLGDFQGARGLHEHVLAIRSRTLPDDDPALQTSRQNLANLIAEQGDFAGERALEEKVLEALARTLPEEDVLVQRARSNLAETLWKLGEFEAARALQARVLEVESRTLPEGHPDLQLARTNLAATLWALGELAEARELEERVLEVHLRTRPQDDVELQEARESLAETIASQVARGEEAAGQDAGRARCIQLVEAICRAHVRAAREAMIASSAREGEARCSSMAWSLGTSLSFASGYGVFTPSLELAAEAFVLSETTRGAALVSAQLARGARGSPQYAELRDALQEAGNQLAELARRGTTSEEFDRARSHREWVERELVALARGFAGEEQAALDFDIASLATTLEDGAAAVGFRSFDSSRLAMADELDSSGRPAIQKTFARHLGAFVVRMAGATPPGSAKLAFVDLGPIAPIESAVRAWRDALGVGSASRGVTVSMLEASEPSVVRYGIALREKILDPLLAELEGARRIVVALDDTLHLVPLDALPVDECSLVGERWTIETRATLAELSRARRPANPTGPLVAFGDVDYAAREPSESTRAADPPDILRGSAWSEGFSALSGTGLEVRGIADRFEEEFVDDAPATVRDRSTATRDELLALAPRARWLHIATHGWFAPESMQSWSDPKPLDAKTGLATRQSGGDQVRGMRPMLLCGLAFAGANLSEDAVGRAPGLVTAEELSTLDLSNCELAVLSACDTNVGECRAGQGVASLQKALQMAGARSVITSLWKVPDEATKELMLDFYRRLWVEKKPKSQALWEAKMMIRHAKDERGAPKYTTRDWAAWVLTGNPE